MYDANAGNYQEEGNGRNDQRHQPQRPAASHGPGGSVVVHPRAKKVEISSAGIAPSRMIRQRASESLRSTMVEGMSRGEVPPSTIMLMRPWSCSRTCSALVHSEAPLRFAEVAVIGIAAAVTTASGILALGTRSATLPVLAVTFKGKREPAFTMMVIGPGQNLRARA